MLTGREAGETERAKEERDEMDIAETLISRFGNISGGIQPVATNMGVEWERGEIGIQGYNYSVQSKNKGGQGMWRRQP